VEDPEYFHLASDEVHSWCVGLAASPEACARLYATLSCDERSRSTRLRFERDRRRFVVAHGVLRELLARYLETRPGRIRYVYNAFGKPGLSPEFGNLITFNLSHSAGLALMAITAGSSVGVDLEYLRAQPQDVEIARHFFSGADVDQLSGLAGQRRTQAFFTCWTKMEAHVKARGEGLTALGRAPSCVAPARHWSLYTLEPAPGYVGALVVEGTGRRLRQHTLTAALRPAHGFPDRPPCLSGDPA